MKTITQKPYRLRFGTPQDAEALAAFAARTFSDAFSAANRLEDMAAYLPTAYGPARQRSELLDPAITTLILESTDDGAMLAFAMLRGGNVPACVADVAAIELWRFYVDRPWHGQGLAQQLMRAVRESARQRGAQTLWLGVWEKNPRAIAFYEKCGFHDVGAHDFWVGSDRQIDRIMMTELPVGGA